MAVVCSHSRDWESAFAVPLGVLPPSLAVHVNKSTTPTYAVWVWKSQSELRTLCALFCFQITCVFSSCAGDPVMGLCCKAEFILGRREFVDWTMCPVLIGITCCFLGRCSEELKFWKAAIQWAVIKKYEDEKSGLVPCFNNVKGRCQLGRNGFKNFEPVVADENQISEAFACCSCWLCPWGIDVWPT